MVATIGIITGLDALSVSILIVAPLYFLMASVKEKMVQRQKDLR